MFTTALLMENIHVTLQLYYTKVQVYIFLKCSKMSKTETSDKLKKTEINTK